MAEIGVSRSAYPVKRNAIRRTVRSISFEHRSRHARDRSRLEQARGDGDPEEGYFELERGGTARSFPRTPACYGFSIIAKVKEGREDAIREYGKTIEAAIAASPDALAPLKLHYLRWVLFDVGYGSALPVPGHLRHRLRQVHRGRGRAVRRRPASPPSSPISKAFPRTGRPTPTAFIKFVREHQCPQLPRVRRVPVRHGGRDQEGAAAQGRVLRHARPDAVIAAGMRRCSNSTTFSTSC